MISLTYFSVVMLRQTNSPHAFHTETVFLAALLAIIPFVCVYNLGKTQALIPNTAAKTDSFAKDSPVVVLFIDQRNCSFGVLLFSSDTRFFYLPALGKDGGIHNVVQVINQTDVKMIKQSLSGPLLRSEIKDCQTQRARPNAIAQTPDKL